MVASMNWPDDWTGGWLVRMQVSIDVYLRRCIDCMESTNESMNAKTDKWIKRCINIVDRSRTPTAKYSVSPIEPKYAAVKGSLGPDRRCCT